MLDVWRLRLLRELSLRGTVAAAARSLHLTGPAVSQQLAVLEREAGVSLLERRGRTLALTAAGQLLVTHAEVVLGNLATAEAELAALRGGALGTVRIAAFPSAAATLVVRMWEPGADPVLRLVALEPERSVPALLAREVDLAVIHSYSLLPRELPACDRVHLLDDPVLLALHPEQAARAGLRAGEPARLTAFAGSAWLVPGPETSCHEMIRRACGAAGFVMRIGAQAAEFGVLTALVARGAGAALVPRLALPADTAGLSLHPLVDPITREVSAVTRPGERGRPELAHVLGQLRESATGE
jgi:DNA-binding transcriptional LysR family regulator